MISELYTGHLNRNQHLKMCRAALAFDVAGAVPGLGVMISQCGHAESVLTASCVPVVPGCSTAVCLYTPGAHGEAITTCTSYRTHISPFTKGRRDWGASMWRLQCVRGRWAPTKASHGMGGGPLLHLCDSVVTITARLLPHLDIIGAIAVYFSVAVLG